MRFLSKQGHLQPHFHSKAKQLSTQLENGLLAGILFFQHVNFEKGMYFFAISMHSSTLERKYKKERKIFYQVPIKFAILEQKS